jgi:hypothetical protein
MESDESAPTGRLKTLLFAVLASRSQFDRVASMPKESRLICSRRGGWNKSPSPTAVFGPNQTSTEFAGNHP